ncbi:hypothetical protein BC940DRAFT_297681 [Gongronella butleri]|nr:hypothetical protein BC940DRAFT_297681 [Gongronella butleri]
MKGGSRVRTTEALIGNYQAKNVLHLAKFLPDARPTYVYDPKRFVISFARFLVASCLKQRRYKDALALVLALIATSKYIPDSYWQIGQEIYKHILPSELPTYLRSTISGITQPRNIENIRALLVYQADHDLHSEMDDLLRDFEMSHEQYPEFCQLYALHLYDQWQRHPDEPPPAALLQWLIKAYKGNCKHRLIIMAYLKVLRHENDLNTIHQITDKCLASQAKHDPELLSFLIHENFVGTQWLAQAIQLCHADPVADPSVIFDKTMSVIHAIPFDDDKYQEMMFERARLISLRLEHGVYDETTMTEAQKLIDDLDTFPAELQYKIAQFMQQGDLPLTLTPQLTNDQSRTLKRLIKAVEKHAADKPSSDRPTKGPKRDANTPKSQPRKRKTAMADTLDDSSGQPKRAKPRALQRPKRPLKSNVWHKYIATPYLLKNQASH